MRFIPRVVFALVSAAFLAAQINSPAIAGENTIDGWRMTQRNREEGLFEVEMCKTALRIYTAKSKLVVLATAPWKEVTLYCVNTGNICTLPMDKFANPWLKTMVMFDGGSLSYIEVIEKGPTKCMGLDAHEYTEKPGFAIKQLARYRQGASVGRAAMTVNYITTDYFKLPPQVGRILCKMSTLPAKDSVPLQFKYGTVSHDKETQLETKELKAVKLKLSDFEKPKGMKVVKEGISVIVPGDSDPGLDLMMMGRTKVK